MVSDPVRMTVQNDREVIEILGGEAGERAARAIREWMEEVTGKTPALASHCAVAAVLALAELAGKLAAEAGVPLAMVARATAAGHVGREG